MRKRQKKGRKYRMKHPKKGKRLTGLHKERQRSGEENGEDRAVGRERKEVGRQHPAGEARPHSVSRVSETPL